MKITSYTRCVETSKIDATITALHSNIINNIKTLYKHAKNPIPFDKLPLNFETKITPITYNRITYSSSTNLILVTIICRYRLDEVL